MSYFDLETQDFQEQLIQNNTEEDENQILYQISQKFEDQFFTLQHALQDTKANLDIFKQTKINSPLKIKEIQFQIQNCKGQGRAISKSIQYFQSFQLEGAQERFYQKKYLSVQTQKLDQIMKEIQLITIEFQKLQVNAFKEDNNKIMFRVSLQRKEEFSQKKQQQIDHKYDEVNEQQVVEEKEQSNQFMNELIQDREKEINQIQKMTLEIGEIMKDTAECVQEQGQQIQMLDSYLEKSCINTEAAKQNIEKYSNFTQKQNKRIIGLFFCSVFMACFVILLFYRKYF